jgi:hypothetical protein
MSRLKDKLAASVRQARDGVSAATPAAPRVRKGPRGGASAPAAPPAPPPVPPAAATGAAARCGFDFPERVWPD